MYLHVGLSQLTLCSDELVFNPRNMTVIQTHTSVRNIAERIPVMRRYIQSTTSLMRHVYDNIIEMALISFTMHFLSEII